MNTRDDKKGPELQGWEVPGVVALVGFAGWHKYGSKIELWFYNHMTEIVMAGVGLLALLGYIVLWRYRKKNEEEISRMRKLRQARGQSQKIDDYYSRGASRQNDRRGEHER